jgi:hypothetical protein
MQMGEYVWAESAAEGDAGARGSRAVTREDDAIPRDALNLPSRHEKGFMRLDEAARGQL